MEEEFAVDMMSNRQSILDQLYNQLSCNGVISVNIAGSTRSVESMNKGYLTPTRRNLQNDFAQELKNLGFVQSYKYEEYNTGLPETRSYVVAFKDNEMSKNWNTNESKTEIKLRNRILYNQSGKLPLEVLDAAKLASYSNLPLKQDLKQTLSIARTKARQAVEQSNLSRMAGSNIKYDVNSSCSSVENTEECKEARLSLPEQSSAELWGVHDTIGES